MTRNYLIELEATWSESGAMMSYHVGQSDTRHWGSWEVIAVGANHVVKSITVTPGKRLSLQYHNHRSEEWTIVQGNAKITLNEDVFYASYGKHISIPKSALHRIENVGECNLVFVEVQHGDQLEENDIVRVSDDYGRAA